MPSILKDRHGRLAGPVLAALAAIVLPSCIQDPPGDIGVGRGVADSAPVIYLGLCPGDSVQAMLVGMAVDGVIGNDDDVVLWRVTRTVGEFFVEPARIEIGNPVPGFHTDVTWDGEASPTQTLTAFVTTTMEIQYSVDFVLSDLTPQELVSVRDQSINLADFAMTATDDCDG